jgi:histone-arginine methyltransferase CARM1
MLQDLVRTGTYQSAFLQNSSDFAGAKVLDVGTGTGLLAFFAAQAGATKVYAVEHAKPMAKLAKALVAGNKLQDVIEVLDRSIESLDTEIDGKVDVIVSEPIGFLLVHERMLESFVAARDKFLKPGGLMMPTTATIFAAPFSDDHLFQEQSAKSNFWGNSNFYGTSFTSSDFLF